MNQVEREERKRLFKEQLNKKLEAKIEKNKRQTFTPPRYDDVYYEGLAWLDSME